MGPEDHKWHYDYVRLAWDTGFSFDKYKYPQLDKNKICLIDIDRIIKERDVASVERFLPTVLQYVLENDQAELLDNNFVKMFRISQLSVEYLLFCKKYLDNTVVLLKKEMSKLKEENKELKLFTEELETHISALTKHNYVTTFKCDKCSKAFSSEEYLNSHIKRRHSNDNKSSTNTETDQLQSEIKQLKERLNVAEKLLQEKNDIVQDVKLDTNENENKLRVDEVLEKFEKFKDKVENDIRILQMEKNFYEEKYSNLLDVVVETNKKDNVNNETMQQSETLSKDPAQDQEITPIRDVVDKIETTTQTEKENVPCKNLQIQTFHNENIFDYKSVEPDSEIAFNRNNIDGSIIEERMGLFEQQLELKISSGLGNIEKQMQAFWGKLSELQLQQRPTIKEQIDDVSPQHEFVHLETSKPKIKPRMKLSKPSTFINKSDENAKKIKAEIEKMYIKPDTTAISVKTFPESNLNKMANVIYDSSELSASEEKSRGGNSDSEESRIKAAPKKISETKPVYTPRKNSVTSLKRAAQSKQVTDKLREEIINDLNNRLQDIGISPNWKGIPQKTFEKALEIVKHQANLARKANPDFDSIRKSIKKSLDNNISQMMKNQTNFNSVSKKANIINIRYRRKSKHLESDKETKPEIAIKNRSLYNTDSDDNEDIQIPTSQIKHLTKVSEAVPSYSAVVRELKMSRTKNVDTDSDVNSIILPQENIINDIQAKSAIKNYPSMGSLTKKKVLFDIKDDGIKVDQSKPGIERRDNLTSLDSSEAENEKHGKKNESSLSDFDFS